MTDDSDPPAPSALAAAERVPSWRRAPRGPLNLLRTQTKADPVILPRQTSVADPEFPCAWKQLLKFLLPKARDSH